MKTILDTITEHKRIEVLKRKGRKPLAELQQKPLYNSEPRKVISSFDKRVPGIIAEFKRKSPSRGLLVKGELDPVTVVNGYKDGGAVCASILTDRDFFGGSFRDLEAVKSAVTEIPLLRKDFMIDEYQVHEAKAYGADVILLIASILDRREVKTLASLAVSLGLTVLLEVHAKEELDKWDPAIGMVGVNNRNLKDFSVDINRSLALAPHMPEEVVRISESGLKTPEDIRILYDAGFQGFLVGEHFMVNDDPAGALRELLGNFNV